MSVVVAPGPASWLPRVMPMAAADGEARVITPRGPGWGLVTAGARIWSHHRTDRRIRAQFVLRSAIDRIAASSLEAQSNAVFAPSLAAKSTFLRARALGLRTILAEDLPNLRELHGDLDAAARAHPESPWLSRFRAPERWLVRQEEELALADIVVVRSRHARRRHLAQGRPFQGIVDLALPIDAVPVPASEPGGCVLLAGLAAARHGVFEAVKATQQAGLMLLVRPGEGAERHLIESRPHVRVASKEEREALRGVRMVLAPAWCECHPEEVLLAVRLGVPVIATAQAAGFLDLGAGHQEIARGDADGLAAAMTRERGWRPVALTSSAGPRSVAWSR